MVATRAWKFVATVCVAKLTIAGQTQAAISNPAEPNIVDVLSMLYLVCGRERTGG